MDIGTNSTRLLIAEQTPGGIRTIQNGLITTRLGEGIGQQPNLQEAAMERTLQALLDFRRIITGQEASRLVVAATSAVRDAANRDDFVTKVRRSLGWEVMVLSGAEEAYASYLGAVRGLRDTVFNPVVIDIGGGSTEFIWEAAQRLNCLSLRLGAVRMTENNSSLADIKKIVSPVAGRINLECLPESAGASDFAVERTLVGVGGTLTTLAAIDQQMAVYDPAKVHGYYLTGQAVARILTKLEGLALEERKQVPGLQPQRADIIIAGARIALAIIEELAGSGVIVSESDIMHGLLQQTLQDENSHSKISLNEL